MPGAGGRRFYNTAKGLFLLLQGLPAPQKRVQMTILLTVCCVSYIAGIITAPLISLSYLLLFTPFVFAAAIIAKFAFKCRVSIIFIAALIFLGGNLRYMIVSENTLYDKFPDKYVEVRGTICSLPSHSDAKHSFRYELELDKIIYLENIYKANGKILLNTDTELSYGDTVSASGFLTDFSSALNEYGTDFAQFYRCRGIFARLTAFEISKTGEKHSVSPMFWMGKLRCRIFKNMQSALPDKDFALACAALFGDSYFVPLMFRIAGHILPRYTVIHQDLIYTVPVLHCLADHYNRFRTGQSTCIQLRHIYPSLL